MSTNEDQTKVLVIGAGFGRTGTESLKLALNNLGYKCYHMHEIHKDRSKGRPVWNPLYDMSPARRAASGVWDKVFEQGYTACVDFPTTCYWNEIMHYYQMKTGLKAKIILTERDSAEQWFNSANESIFPLVDFAGPFGLVRWFGHIRIMYTGQFDGKLSDKAFCMARYEEHNEYVKKTVPSDQLLILNMKRDSANGYQQLIDFLEIDDQSIIDQYKDQPLPRSNSKARFAKTVRNVKIVRSVLIMLVGLAVSAVSWYGYQMFFPVTEDQ